MAHRYLSLRNLPVAVKLFGGFAILIAIIIISSLISIQQADTIRDHALKGKLISEISDDLNTARRNRIAYQVSHDEKALQANKEAIDKMAQKVVSGETFTWDSDARVLFDSLRKTIPAYADGRDAFVRLEELTVTAQQALTADSLKASLEKYSQQLSVKDQPARYEVSLLNALNRVWSDVFQIQSSDGQKGWAEFDADYKAAMAFLASSDVSVTATDKNDARAFLGQIQANTAAYSAARKASQTSATSLTDLAANVNKAITGLVTSQTQNNLDIIQRVMIVMVLVALCAVATGLLIAWLLTRQMTQQIRHNLTLAERIAQGDLTAVIEPQSTDELGRLTMAMAAMNDRLREMISRIKESVSHVASASSEISAGNTDLASRTEEQSAAVVETAASMEQLTSTVKRNADNAREASQLASVAADHARSGGKIVGDVVSTMGAITESSKKITEIISVINGISFQTNILALNAAVEAARAGEQGRGFAVVAGEVRSLAQRSAQAAKEIEGLIQESVERVHTGSEMANKAGSTMGQIVASVTNVSGIMNEISDASEEQSRGIDQIGKAVTELDSTTQQNAALVQESSAAASSLEQQADQLAQLVSVFRLGNETQDKQRRPAVAQVPARLHPVALPDRGGDWESF